MKKKRIDMLHHRSLKDIINLKKILVSNTVGPRVSINLDGQGKMKMKINPPELCGVPKLIIPKTKKSRMKTI